MINNNLDIYMSEEDKNDIANLQFIRKNLLKNIGIKNFINMMRDIIDNSEKFEFTSAAKRKFINEITPVFTIKLKDFTPLTARQLNDIKYVDNEINKIVGLVNNDILRHTTESILKLIENDETLKKIYSKFDEDLKGLMWTTIYEIRVSIKDNIINVRYCI